METRGGRICTKNTVTLKDTHFILTNSQFKFGIYFAIFSTGSMLERDLLMASINISNDYSKQKLSTVSMYM